MKVLTIVLAAIVALFVIVEVSLRLLFGFGNPLTYIADEKIGYLLAPNQRTRRFGNRIEINEYSMRSGAVTKERSPDTFRVLVLGDSIANGGWWTDQTNIISEMLAQQLREPDGETRGWGDGEMGRRGDGENFASSQNPIPPRPPLTRGEFKIQNSHVEVLNASANSWGPRNELAYLQRFGTFDAQVVVLIINTDDLFATTPSSVVVGRDRNYPDRKPPLAIVEAIARYLLPEQTIPELAQVNAEGGDRVGRNLEAIGKIQAMATSTNSHFLLVMTPLLREIGKPGPRDYEIKARSRIAEFTESQQLKYIDFLPVFNSIQQPETLYRDHIHLSPQGNQLVSKAISQGILDLVMGNR